MDTKLLTNIFVISLLLLPAGSVLGVEEEAKDAKSRQEEIKEKKKKLESVEKKVNLYEETVGLLEGKEVTLNAMLKQINGEIESIEGALVETDKSLMETQKSVNEKEHEVIAKEEEIRNKKLYLGEYVRTLNTLDKRTLIEILLEKPRISDYFNEVEAVFTFQRKLGGVLDDLNESRQALASEKEELKSIELKQMSLRSMQQQQRVVVERNRTRKEELLAKTQGQQEKFGKLLDEGSEIAGKLRAELTALQSLGTEINFETAVRTAKKVEGITGTRASFLLGVLKVESNMGNNVGGGKYKTDMSPKQWDKFKAICKELGYDPKEMPVSRKPCYRDKKGNCRGWGGAMGPAQFMPSTWMGYKKLVEKQTGRKPADPWSLEDALTAMGIKLAKVPGVTDHDKKAEKKAAGIYLAGGNWKEFSWYGDRVLGFADGYEKVLKD